MSDKHLRKRVNLAQTEVIDKLPKACSSEAAAVEFFEAQRWGDTPCCVHCGSIKVYKMLGRDGERSKRYLWRCRDCGKQYTVRVGTIYEESRIDLRHWAYAFWRAATSKKGVAALEIMRHCQISYKSALFLMHRIRHAVAPVPKPMGGVVEFDETYCGGKPRPGNRVHKRGRGTDKTPVFAMVERGGDIHRRVVANVSGPILRKIINQVVDKKAKVMTDENRVYRTIGREFAGGHGTVNHSLKEYAVGDRHVNTCESSFAILKRGLIGIHHAVSTKHLHRYVSHYDFLWNSRFMNDGQRTIAAIKASEGKRLFYREPIQQKPAQDGEQLPMWPA